MDPQGSDEPQIAYSCRYRLCLIRFCFGKHIELLLYRRSVLAVVSNWLTLIVYFLVSCIPVFSAKAATLCEGFYNGTLRSTRYLGREITYQEVRVKKEWNKFIEPKEAISDYQISDLIVGFTGDHVYLFYQGKRYDPGMHIAGRTSKIRNSDYLSPGILLRFKNFPHNSGEKLLRNLLARDGERPTSCAAGICNLLRESDIDLQGFNVLPSHLIRNTIKGGLSTFDGEKLVAEIYLLNAVEFAEQMQLNRQGELGVAKAILVPILAVVGAAAALGNGLILFR